MSKDKITITEEVWKPVPFEAYKEHYSISNFGRLRREKDARFGRAGMIMKLDTSRRYARAQMIIDGQRYRTMVHRIVALAFLDPPTRFPIKQYHVHHKDGNPCNNHVSNLEWLLPKQHATKHPITQRDNPMSPKKLTWRDVFYIRQQRAAFVPVRLLQKELDVSKSTIISSTTRQTWNDLTKYLPSPFYRDDNAALTIYHADNKDILPLLSGIDLVVTSPPYNMGNATGAGIRGLGHYDRSNGITGRGGRRGNRLWNTPDLSSGYDAYGDDLPHEEYVRWQQTVLRACWYCLSRRGAIYYNHKPRILAGRCITPYTYVPNSLTKQHRQTVIWQRAGGINHTGAFYTPTHEWIVILAKNDFRLKNRKASVCGDVWYVPQEACEEHPAPFPLPIPYRAIETTAPGLVLDPFMGWGTTLVAAKMLGVPAIGIDNSKAYCERAVRRLEATRRDMFTPPPSNIQFGLFS